MESGFYTRIGNWWDRKGKNEIDLLAINEFNHTALAAEVKRNPKKINLAVLKEKIQSLPPQYFDKYTINTCGLSIEDM